MTLPMMKKQIVRLLVTKTKKGDKNMIIGGLDVGTTGCKLTLFNENGDFVFNSYKPYEVSRVNGEYEIDPETILESVKTVISTCYKNVGRIDGIGVTTFGETFVSLDANDKGRKAG